MQPLNLPSFEEEARAVVDQARAKARELLTAALKEAAGIRERARLEGLEKGREEGRAAAEPAERKRIGEQTAGVQKLLEEMVRSVGVKRDDLIRQAERDLVRLSLAIAARIVRAEVAAGRPVAEANVRRAIELLARRDRLEVRLHPEDFEQVERFLPEVRARFLEIKQLSLARSPDVARGGCRVVTEQGVVDADLQVQLDEIERALLGGKEP